MGNEIFDLVRDGTKRAQRRSAFLTLVCLPHRHTDADFEKGESRARDNNHLELKMGKSRGPVSALLKRAAT